MADIAHADPCSRLRPGTLIPIIHALIPVIHAFTPSIHTLIHADPGSRPRPVRSTERSALACPAASCLLLPNPHPTPTPPHPTPPHRHRQPSTAVGDVRLRSGSKIARTTFSAPAKRAPSSTGQRHAICARRLALHLVAWHCSHPAQSSEPCARAGVR